MPKNTLDAWRALLTASGINVGRLQLPGAEPCACTTCGGIGCNCADYVIAVEALKEQR